MSNNLIVTGNLYKKFELEKVSASLDKREFVIETDGEYPQLIKFELINDKCRLLDDYELGKRVKVSFNLRGREWKKDAITTVYFNSLQAWRLEVADEANTTATASTKAETPKAAEVVKEDGEDLPF